MKQTIDCLDPRDIASLLSGELDLVRQAEFEQHLADCPACCCRLQQAVGNNDWWDEIESSLQNVMLDEWRDSGESTSELFGFGAFEDMAPGESRSAASLLKLLGPTDDPEMLGRIGPYEIVGLLGQGGMGAVFKGFDRTLNRFVAIKMMLPHLATSGAARKRFAREGKAIAAVVDDHVMAIHCVDEWQGLPYLVMNYSRGLSLQKRLSDNGPMELRAILRIGMQSAKGLAAAHAQGIVHRDIKPANIFLDPNVERVQLMDFGLARAVDDASLTRSGTLAGTPQYMSPEQARAEAVDHRSDLFSLGSVMYAMCTGHSPFRAESSYSVLRLIIDKEPRPIRQVNPDIPDWLCWIIGKLMSKSLQDRYASADEIAILFEQCIAHVQDPVQHALPLAAQEFGGRIKPKCFIVSKLQRWFPIMSDKRIVSLISLLLLLTALLVPWPIATMGKVEPAIAFAVVSALLSLVFALLSRAEYFSRIVLWGFGLTIGLAVVGICLCVPIKMLREQSSAVQAREAEAIATMQADVAAKQERLKADAEAKPNPKVERKMDKLDAAASEYPVGVD
ncbi:MAG: protein kinase [Pirellula sp.]|jgi:serine/threonine protein kinase|nr:protein kinase [Pirellula sp.]MCU0721185.1 protein kinase [Pirellula sp.]